MATPPSLLGDQSDSSGNSGGFLQGLLSLFKPDYSAEYTGSLAKDPTTGQMDPAVQRAFALRALAGASQAFAQGGMPVPYKGGIPLLSTIGQAGAAATLGPDSLIDARLKAAQQQQAMAAAGLSQGQLGLLSTLGPAYQALIKKGTEAQSGGGTGPDGKPTGPAKVLASGGGAGGISPTDHYTFLLNNGASKNEATMLTSAANSESSFRPDLTHDGGIGYGLYGHNDTRLAAMRTFAGVGPNDPVPWQQQALYALAELRGQVPGLPGGGEPKAGAMVNAATNPEQLTAAQLAFERPNLNIAGGNRAQRLASTTEYWNKPPYAEQPPTQTASAGSAPASGAQVGPYAPVPGQPPPQGVYVPPGGTKPLDIQTGQPSAPSAAAPLPAPPPSGSVGGKVSGLLGAQPEQAIAAAVSGGPKTGGGLLAENEAPAGAPPLSPAAAAILQGTVAAQGGGLPASGSVAGPGAPSEPPQAVGGSVGGDLKPPSLLQQPPPAGAAPAPVMPPPPVPGPAPPQAAPGPQGPPGAPPVNLPPIPSQMPPMPAMPAPPQATPQQMIAQGIAGISSLTGHPAPQFIQDLAGMPTQMALEQYKAWVGAQANMMTEQYKKQIEVSTAGTISYLQSQGQLPADLTKMTNEQNLKLRNAQAEKGLEQKPDGSWGFMPGYIEQQGQLEKQKQDLQQQREIAVKNAENQNQMQRDLQQEQNKIAMLPLQKRQEALFTDYADNVQKPAGTADNARKTLAALGNSLSNFQTGAFAPQRLDIAKMWNDAVRTLGVTPSAAVQQMIASGETISKEGNTLGFELAKELGSRESQLVIQAAIASNPGLAMSPQGNAQLIKLLDNGLQRDIAKKGFYDQYFLANRSYEGADAAFRKQNPVEVTVSSVPGLEYHPKTPQDIAQYPPGTRYVRPDAPGKVYTVPPNG